MTTIKSIHGSRTRRQPVVSYRPSDKHDVEFIGEHHIKLEAHGKRRPDHVLNEMDILRRGFDAGNYDGAYNTRKGCLSAYLERLQKADLAEGIGTSEGRIMKLKMSLKNSRAFRAAYFIGYYSSYEPREIPAQDRAAVARFKKQYGSKLAEVGISV